MNFERKGKNGMKRLCALCAVLLLAVGWARAADETQALARSQAGEMTDALTGEAAALMRGVPERLEDGLGEAVAQLAENAAVGGRSAWTSALCSLGKLLLVAVLCGMLQGIRTAAGQEELPLVTMAGALGMTGVLLSDL